MSAISVLGAVGLACIGSWTAEHLRLRRRWIPDIRQSYGWSAAVSAVIVCGNAMVGSPGQPGPYAGNGDIVLLAAGMVAYGVLWLLILMAWRHCRASRPP